MRLMFLLIIDQELKDITSARKTNIAPSGHHRTPISVINPRALISTIATDASSRAKNCLFLRSYFLTTISSQSCHMCLAY
ncbi:hypothetical protein L2E82_02216 [Cichorium intybus]|uniref:Uncharacterized protein n=1 Tax=Cichorium intybus TaxID=13427 RepID=A0ACB9H272_CICIN|nr:hypothetical protein L2E82_02216 [Cichorium intybus]